MVMSTRSQRYPLSTRDTSLQDDDRSARPSGRPRRRSTDGQEVYSYALRVAYLSYLLQPRQKRTKIVKRPQHHRSSTVSSFSDVMKDFTVVRDSKTSKYPHAFVRALEKRLQGIIKSEERRPEYQDPHVKRTFAIFLNTLTEQSFRRQAEENKRAEDLVLMFYSRASRELSIGKPPHDEGVARMVDRHVALFVRLMSLILREKGWAEERRDLTIRLQDLEKKLLKHEEDLAGPTPHGEGGQMVIQEEVPLTYTVEDMPLVQVVGQIFELGHPLLQADIDAHKSLWTEAEALKDLKTYQAHLSVGGTNKTLGESDFDTKDAFEEWKKGEIPEVTQMIVSIMTLRPAIAKMAGSATTPQIANQRTSTMLDEAYSELGRALSPTNDSTEFDMPDLNGLQVEDDCTNDENDENVYTFIPTSPDTVRDMFKFLVDMALTHDLELAQCDSGGAATVPELMSKQSVDLLHEVAVRWRLPRVSRIVIFLDCVHEKFAKKQLSLEQLDEAFNYAKTTVQDDAKQKRAALVLASITADRHKWSRKDFGQLQHVLQGVHKTLLDNLYQAILTCYDAKPSPALGMILAVIDQHLTPDPLFIGHDVAHAHRNGGVELFGERATQGLMDRAREIYSALLHKEVPAEQDAWEFYHIIQLSRKVLAQLQKTQKRFRGVQSKIAAVEPLTVLMVTVLPLFAVDSEAMIRSVLENARLRGAEVPMEDGFELYKALSEFREVYEQALPDQPYPCKIEELLQDFVWRWVNATNAQVIEWVEQSIKNDDFQTRNENKQLSPTEDQRHSTSVLDVFRFFNQVVDQIKHLNWRDELALAKFMTALAKALSQGITRYCEVVDDMFSKEMDRLTPEQRAAQNSTRQEKYMKMAKEVWLQDNKMEPFQFYPESFVKLNDISLAIHQWDKLDKEMGVDECMAIIQRYNPVSLQQPRKISNYVFTIKVVEAEGLKAMDVNGYSDPYVVLTDEYQKRLFKTKTVYRNLNPRWEESVDISTQGALNLIATVWDWDAVGDHDYVGRTSLKLDPLHFSDLLPREYWQPLDTQGRVLIKVNMDGERDDLQFYFARAFRALQRTQRDMTRKITDKLSSYISYCLSRRTLRNLTSKSLSGQVAAVSSFLSAYRRGGSNSAASSGSSETEITAALQPLFAYFNDNFSIMNQTLTSDAMIAVMSRLWKEVLVTIESLLVPALSDLPSQQRQLNQAELDIVFKWLQQLFDFFHVVDAETGQATGVPLDVLKSPKYHEIQSLNFFYFESTENLIRISERIASASASAQAASRYRLSAPPSINRQQGLLGPTATAKRAKSIMVARNLGTMRKAKEEKWKQAQAEPSDDIILRILRMRPEAHEYLRDRSRQKERLAAAAAAKAIVEQSLAQGGGRMTGPSVVRR